MTMRAADEIRDHLIWQVNQALRRPSAYGGEIALRLYFDAVLVSWNEEQEQLRTTGTFTSIGVHGGVEKVVGEQCENTMTSVYAEIAHQYGFLHLERPLAQDEYEAVRAKVGPWCAEDREIADVLAEFGTPSVQLGSSNPNYPTTFGYGTANPGDPLAFFRLWNGTSAESGSQECGDRLLLSVRCGGKTFADGFTFTPLGAARRRVLLDAIDRKHREWAESVGWGSGAGGL